MEEASGDMQDIAEQRAILESIRLYESEQQYKLAIQRSMNTSKKAIPELAGAINESSSDPSSDDDDDSKSAAESEFEDFSSDEEETAAAVQPSNNNISDDLIKKIKDELRLEILESLKNEQSGKGGKKKK